MSCTRHSPQLVRCIHECMGDLGMGDLGMGDLGTGDLGMGDLGTGDLGWEIWACAQLVQRR